MKKRLFTLCFALTAMTLGAMAEELNVAGNKVDLSGTGEVSVSGGDIKSGYVKYDRDKKTLTLRDVTIERSGNNNRGIFSNVSGLTVVFSGDNRITTTSAAGLRFEASATITGSGTTFVISKETALYVYKKTSVTIKGSDKNRLLLHLDGKYGIQGETSSNGEKVTAQRWATLEVVGTTNRIKNLNNLTMSGDAKVTMVVSPFNDPTITVNNLASLTLYEGIAINRPLGGKYNSDKKTFVQGSSTTAYKSTIIIEPARSINATDFPDANFRSYISGTTIDQNSDGYLSSDEIEATTKMDVSNRGISDLTGIGYFTKLKELNCAKNKIRGDKMTALVNSLPSEGGTLVVCAPNSSIDNDISPAQVQVAKNKGWEVLSWTSVNGKDNYASYAGAPGVEINNNIFPDANFRKFLLEQGYSDDNFITVYELSTVKSINVSGKGIYNLKGIERFTSLQELRCHDNKLTALDLSSNTKLSVLTCYQNNINVENMTSLLTSLPTRSGNDGKLYVYNNDGEDNVITPGQVQVVTGKGWKVMLSSGEAYAGFVPIDIDETNFPDDKFRNYLIAQEYGRDRILTGSEIQARKRLKLCYQGIKDLKGIEFFTALTILDCMGNSLTSLDVSKNTALEELWCSNCDLTSLDVSKNTSLTVLLCSGNHISGESMTKLIQSMPLIPSGSIAGAFIVCDDLSIMDNYITPSQVKTAINKRWIVKKFVKYPMIDDVYSVNFSGTANYAGVGDVNADNKIDENDLDLIVKIIMYKEPKDVSMGAGNVNNDDKVDVADAVEMVNILKSLGK